MSKARDIPKAMRWQTLTVIVIVALIAVLIGAVFAGPVRSGLSAAGRWLGFGHDHEDEAVAVTDESGEVQYYTCGMHPWVILPQPGDCPICHMDLTPIDPAKFTGEIAIDPVVVQNMGVRVEPVVTGPLTKRIRTVGVLRHAESTMVDISPRYTGWVEKLHVDYAGRHVMAGEPLFEVYSPQLYAAQQEWFVAGDDAELQSATRERLLNLGVSETDIDAMVERGGPSRTVTIHSPITGHVVDKSIVEGSYIEPGDRLYHLADHSRVWIDIAIYEQHIPYIKEGMSAEITIPAMPGRTLRAEVIYVAPHLNHASRQLEVRVEVPTPEHRLKPGMYANVTLENTLAEEKTLAPRSAVIDTGERQVAFVSRGDGRFEPRDVRMGLRTGDGMVEIISGLEPGEMVVTSGQFLIDSESKMREAIGKMVEGEPAVERAAPAEASTDASGSTSDATPSLRRADEGEALTPYPLDTCLVTEAPLDSMGGAVRYAYADQEILFCCEGCPPAFRSDPQRYLAALRERTDGVEAGGGDDREASP